MAPTAQIFVLTGTPAMRVILLDIEGTTTPISFVYEILFPFARERMRAFVQAQLTESAFAPTLDALHKESEAERSAGHDAPLVPKNPTDANIVADFALWLMDKDRKSTALKEIQGQIWREGYENGTLKGVVYPDVHEAMKRWKDAGRRVAIYSSGSIQAQKLIFGYSDLGDLRPLIDAYFDTTTGPKKEAESYQRIARALDVQPADILFLSDNIDELHAASAAGVNVRLAVRPGNAPVMSDAYARVEQFKEKDLGV